MRIQITANAGSISIIESSDMNLAGDTTGIYDVVLIANTTTTLSNITITSPTMTLISQSDVLIQNTSVAVGIVNPTPNLKIYSLNGSLSVLQSNVSLL